MRIEPTRLEAAGPDGLVPALLFMPPDAEGPLPLLLLGHGAHLSKDDPIMQILARGLCRGVPAGVALMDCPGHGERRAPDTTDAQFEADVARRMSDPENYKHVTTEWTEIAATARAAAPQLTGPLAYAGFSMGAMFGLAIVADLPDVRAALLALGGLVREGGPDPEGARRRNALIRDGARRIGEREVMMLNMTRDEYFPIEGAVEVLEAMPGPKRMGVWDGTHEQIPPEAVRLGIDFLRRVLAA